METIEEMKRFLAERICQNRETCRQGGSWAFYALNEDELLLRLIDEQYARCDTYADCTKRIEEIRSGK